MLSFEHEDARKRCTAQRGTRDEMTPLFRSRSCGERGKLNENYILKLPTFFEGKTGIKL